MFDRGYRWAWCVLSGILLVAGFAPFASATCGWIALVPAWWLLTRSAEVRRTPMRHGYLIGLIYFGGTFWWISNVTGIGTFFLVLYLALYPAVWFQLVTRFLLRSRQTGSQPTTAKWAGVPVAVGAAALWVILEWWRSWFLTGFNWNELGITQAPSLVFRQLAAFGGVHLISFLLVTVNILWAEGIVAMIELARTRRVVRPSPPFAVAMLLVAIAFALGWHHLQRHIGPRPLMGPSFAAIQPNIPQIPPGAGGTYAHFQKTEAAALEKMEELSETSITAAAKPDLLIWPEATIDEGVFQDRPLNEAVHDICQTYGGYFLLGSQDFDLGMNQAAPVAPGGAKARPVPKLYNVAYFFTPGGEQYDEYRKTRLVILGEFLPFGNDLLWLRKLVGIGIDFTPGPGPVIFTMKSPALRIAPLICFEDTLASVADKAARLRPDVFITITNDGWYTGLYAQWGGRQHLNHAVFRCVEHDLPMVRCANTGISCVINEDGTVAPRFLGPSGADLDVGGIFTGRLVHYARGRDTFYERWGDWIVLLSSVVTVMLGVRFLVHRAR